MAAHSAMAFGSHIVFTYGPLGFLAAQELFYSSTAYAIPNRMVAMMRGQTVYVSPSYETVVWAYPQLRFDPLPLIADYSAYTPSLDQLPASFCASPGRSTDATRHLNLLPPNWPSSTATVRWRRDGNSWQLLERGADRCSRLQPLGTVNTGFDHRTGEHRYHRHRGRVERAVERLSYGDQERSRHQTRGYSGSTSPSAID
jgi:hypothetical protein